jgi:hypothetical protein
VGVTDPGGQKDPAVHSRVAVASPPGQKYRASHSRVATTVPGLGQVNPAGQGKHPLAASVCPVLLPKVPGGQAMGVTVPETRVWCGVRGGGVSTGRGAPA